MTDQDKSTGPIELVEDDLETTSGGLSYKLDGAFIKSWSTSGDADDRPSEEVAFYYNKISF
ncbi:MAG: hypothetical protein AAF317_02595 [Pseudomonadota bacterium]